MNRLSSDRRVRVVAALVEGNGINATARITGVSKPTILKLLADLGTACAAYQDRVLRNLASRRIQCDEIWQFCYAKQKNVPTAKTAPAVAGDVGSQTLTPARRWHPARPTRSCWQTG